MSSGDRNDSIHEKMEMNNGHNHMESLSRQITMQISPEQYERLFFQPTAAKGDLSKRLGNPTLLGVCGFLIPFQTTIFCILGWKGANVTSLVEVSGAFYFLGGIAMVLTGIFEFILGNTYPMAVFIIYGAHWCQVAYSFEPVVGLGASYGTTAAAIKAENSGAAFYNLTMTLVSTVFFLGSLRTNAPFALAIFCLIPLFALFAAAQWHIGYYPTPAGEAYAFYLFKIAGGFGLVTALCGWYLAIIAGCASTGVPCPLPIFDLSTKVFGKTNAASLEHAGGGQAAHQA